LTDQLAKANLAKRECASARAVALPAKPTNARSSWGPSIIWIEIAY